MTVTDPRREFAVEAVLRLRGAGFEALWAGGCVRDFLLGKTPRDYDVATNARPEEVRRLFGHRGTVPVGASFGVIMVLGPTKSAGQIEVATFRAEGPYLDGRRPEHVVFCTAEEDARRRDFTINGMFYDPVAAKVLDYVGGERDLSAGIVRAIGDPHDRMREDKLRMLRAVRFAATLEFRLDPATRAALSEMAPQIHVVSVERIAQELKRMLVDPRRRRAMELAEATGVLREILPELGAATGEPAWDRALQRLRLLNEPSFELAFAALLLGVADDDGESPARVCRRLKLSNDESDAVSWLVAHRSALADAPRMTLARLKRLFAHPRSAELLALFRAETLANDGDLAPVAFCDEFLRATPPEAIDPPPLIHGGDLIRMGLEPGPSFKEILDAIRDAQLNGEVTGRDEATALARRIASL